MFDLDRKKIIQKMRSDFSDRKKGYYAQTWCYSTYVWCYSTYNLRLSDPKTNCMFVCCLFARKLWEKIQNIFRHKKPMILSIFEYSLPSMCRITPINTK